jgi:AmmeMemoRadiSam system protein B
MIVPVVLAHASGAVYKKIGGELARAIKESKKGVIILASSDMTHYEPHGSAKRKDSQAIEAMLDLDGDKLLKRVDELDISMCGYAPVVSLISAAKELGAKGAELVKYQTSGDASGDYSSVVGYAGVIIK